jgi:hypothetical protein
MWANRSRSLPRQVCDLGGEVPDTGVIERIEISSKTGLAHVAIKRLDAIVRVHSDACRQRPEPGKGDGVVAPAVRDEGDGWWTVSARMGDCSSFAMPHRMAPLGAHRARVIRLQEAKMLKRKFASVAVAAVLAGSVIGPTAAFANVGIIPPPPPPTAKSKCNSGNGNGSDTITFVAGAHCYGGDPGQSFFHNKGGDEIPTAGGIANPGGNNVG